MGVLEPLGFYILHIYEHAEAAAFPCNDVQQTLRVLRRKDDSAVFSILRLHCGVYKGAVQMAKERVDSDCIKVNVQGLLWCFPVAYFKM